MVILELNEVEIDFCTGCNGIWLDSGELDLLLEDAEERGTLKPGGTIIANEDTFDERNLAKAGYPINVNPLEDGSLDNYTLIKVPMTSITKEACADLGVKPRDADRSKNFFALGLVSWMYSRPVDMKWRASMAAKQSVGGRPPQRPHSSPGDSTSSCRSR